MKFTASPIAGVFQVELEPRGDERGFFARVFCREEAEQHGLDPQIVQVNTSFSADQGTLRGLHYQVAPYGETKLVRCVKGEIFDVVLDLRERSPTFGHWFGTRLSADNRTMLYVPRGCAHGFLTLVPESEIIYFVSSPYQGSAERIVRWNDPQFCIAWPAEPQVMSEKDRSAPDFAPATHATGYA